MTNPYRNINELREWLKANSSGAYRPSAHAATVIEEQESELITLRAENSELREKLEAMESQGPAGKITKWLNGNTAICSGEGFAAADIYAEIYFRPVPTDKPAVAVPDGWKLVPVEPTSLMCQAVTENMFVDVFVKERMKSRGWSMEEILNHKRYMTMLAVAPSHSHQNAATDAERFCDEHCTWRDHHPDCPQCGRNRFND